MIGDPGAHRHVLVDSPTRPHDTHWVLIRQPLPMGRRAIDEDHRLAPDVRYARPTRDHRALSRTKDCAAQADSSIRSAATPHATLRTVTCASATRPFVERFPTFRAIVVSGQDQGAVLLCRARQLS